jgi:aryl-alcohol dehydrogenase-like predicted oxidoreductase
LKPGSKNLVLGTANFGNVYGVASVTRSAPLLEKKQARELYELAVQLGIRHFDTAQDYGDSLPWIAEFSRDDDVEVRSKVSTVNKSNDQIISSIESQIKMFDSHNFNCLNLLQFHNWIGSEKDADQLNTVRNSLGDHWSGELGATTYGIQAAMNAINEFDNLQIEWNILNQGSYLAIDNLLRNQNTIKLKKISIRSIFLQGLLTLDVHEIPLKFRSLSSDIAKFHKMIESSGISRMEFIVRSFFSLDFADSLVIGVDNTSQLREVSNFFDKGPLHGEIHRQILKFEPMESNLVDPRNW